MIRLLLLLLGTLGVHRPGQRVSTWYRADDRDLAPEPDAGYPGWHGPPAATAGPAGRARRQPGANRRPASPAGRAAVPAAAIRAAAASRWGSSGPRPCW